MPCTSATGGTIWIYTGAYNGRLTTTATAAQLPRQAGRLGQSHNRAKSRDRTNYNGTLAFHGWGYAWLVNRRVLYNNGEVPGDVADFPMGPDSCARLFVSTNTARASTTRAGTGRSIVCVDTPQDRRRLTLPGRSTQRRLCLVVSRSHTEPYETPRTDLGDAGARTAQRDRHARDLLPIVAGSPATLRGDVADLPARAHHHPVRRALPGWPDHSQQRLQRRSRARAVDRDQLRRRPHVRHHRRADGSTSSRLAAIASTAPARQRRCLLRP